VAAIWLNRGADGIGEMGVRGSVEVDKTLGAGDDTPFAVTRACLSWAINCAIRSRCCRCKESAFSGDSHITFPSSGAATDPCVTSKPSS
jgi:hypothetical protein